MRRLRVRLTIGRLMVAVASYSLGTWMGVAAYHIHHDPECRWVRHVWVRQGGPDDYPNPAVTTCVVPFWPQYWRKLLGRPWPGTFACDCWDRTPHPIGIGVGTGCRPYRLAETMPVSRDEVWGIEASYRSLKTLGLGSTLNSIPTNPWSMPGRSLPSPRRPREDE